MTPKSNTKSAAGPFTMQDLKYQDFHAKLCQQ